MPSTASLRPTAADREILRLAVPAFFALVAEPLFLLADSAIVGQLGTAPLAGLGVAAALLTTAVSLCVFLAYGTTASVARRVGAGDVAGALQQGVDGLWLATVLGVVLAAGGLPLAEPAVQAMGADAGVVPYALTYLRISLLGLPAMLLVLAATGVLRGLQDTRTPLVVASAAAVANVGLNLVLVHGLGWGIAGSAWGTVVAQYGAAAAFLAVVGRGTRRHGVALRPDWRGVRAAGTAGVPLLVRTLTLRAVLLVATYAAAGLGTVPLAAHQVAFTIWGFLAFALDALAIAGQALVGRTLGAADAGAARAATRRMVAWGVGAGVVLAVLVLVLRPAYVPVFSDDPAVRALLADALVVVALLQPVAGVVFVLDGVLIGAGDGAYLARAGGVVLVAFLPLAALATDLVGLWWALGGFMAVRLVTLVARERGDAWLVTGATR